VLSSNDGCVVARSNEVKAMGIPMGVPYFKVREELEQAKTAVFSSNFTLYRDISARVMTILRQELDKVEQYSVDEAFFALEGEEEDVFEAAKRLKHVVETRVGVPVSVGIGKTKTIAKCAVEVGKKGSGVAVLHGREWQEFQQTLPVHEIWGIGGKTAQKMKQHGIETVTQLLAADRTRIDKLFGISGLRMCDELYGRPVYKLDSARELQKSIMSSRSFKAASTNLNVLLDAVRYHVSHAAEELREIDGLARSISVSIRPSRHGDWVLRGGSREVILTVPTNDTRILQHEAVLAAQHLFEAGVPYKKVGVTLGGIQPTESRQQQLFSDHDDQGTQKLMRVIDGLNRQLGSDIVLIGRTKNSQTWQPGREQLSPAYTTNWSEIKLIKL